MKRPFRSRNIWFTILAAAILMIVADVLVLYSLSERDKAGRFDAHSEITDLKSARPDPAKQEPVQQAESLPAPVVGEKYTVERSLPPPVLAEAEQEAKPFKPMTWEEASAPVKPKPKPEPVLRKEGEPAKIVIIIDDMGMDRRRSQRALEMPGPLTLAFLPYAPKIEGMTQEAGKRGHELLIHMPMEATDTKMNLGSISLRSGMGGAEMEAMLDKAFDSFEGYVGINNHMGSKLTQDESAMEYVMKALKERNLIFVDSKTSAKSVASDVAGFYGLAHADRDVFLDHVETPEFSRKALRQLERIAMKKGYAIAIGHPKDITLNALAEWIPTLKDRGFVLVPVSNVARRDAPSTQTSSVSYYGPVQPPSPPPERQPLPY